MRWTLARRQEIDALKEQVDCFRLALRAIDDRVFVVLDDCDIFSDDAEALMAEVKSILEVTLTDRYE